MYLTPAMLRLSAALQDMLDCLIRELRENKQTKKGGWHTAKLSFPSKDPILQNVVYIRASPPAFNNDLIEEAKPTEDGHYPPPQQHTIFFAASTSRMDSL